jgi:hypothetical protein
MLCWLQAYCYAKNERLLEVIPLPFETYRDSAWYAAGDTYRPVTILVHFTNSQTNFVTITVFPEYAGFQWTSGKELLMGKAHKGNGNVKIRFIFWIPV